MCLCVSSDPVHAAGPAVSLESAKVSGLCVPEPVAERHIRDFYTSDTAAYGQKQSNIRLQKLLTFGPSGIP